MARRTLFLAGLLCVTCFTVSCKRDSEPTDKTVIKGAGATFPNPLYQKWTDVYNKKNPNVLVKYHSVGSGAGIRLFMSSKKEDRVDFAGSDAALSPEDLKVMNGKGRRGAILVPMTAGSIAIAYNLEEITGELKLPRDVYADIFMGKITRWNDSRIKAANPSVAKKLPDESIAVVVRADGSGTTFAFTNHLCAISPDWKQRIWGNKTPPEPDYMGVKKLDWPNAMAAPGNEGVAGRIKRTPASIGYVEYGIAHRAGLQMASLENKAGQFVAPTGTSGLAAVINAKLEDTDNLRAFAPDPSGKYSYPIVTFTWIILYKEYSDRTVASELAKFSRWCLHEGQDYNASLGYIRVPPDTANMAIEAIDKQLLGK